MLKLKSMKLLFSFIFIFGLSTSFSQTIVGSEIGVDGYLGASNLGGSFGAGLKYGFKSPENLIFGPSVRLMRTWSNYLGIKTSYNIWGGGVFAHYRYQNSLFAGAEFEMLKSPISYTAINPSTNWAATLFIGAGFSREFNQKIRLNIGLFYDVINADNSPFRPSYFMKIKDSQTGQVTKILPFIYRLAVFIPLGNKEILEEEMEDDDSW